MLRSALIAAALLTASYCSITAQQTSTEPTFVLNPNRAYLYVQFDHLGPGTPRRDGERPMRVWLRLVNNCAISIEVSANGFPEGHQPADEVPLLDQVTKNSPAVGGDLPLRIPKADSMHQSTKRMQPSLGYLSDVSGTAIIQPGKSILFSLPTTQFAEEWHIEIPYKFDVPEGKGPRPDDIGGEPVMYLEYALWWLPPDVQKQINAENAKLRP